MVNLSVVNLLFVTNELAPELLDIQMSKVRKYKSFAHNNNTQKQGCWIGLSGIFLGLTSGRPRMLELNITFFNTW